MPIVFSPLNKKMFLNFFLSLFKMYQCSLMAFPIFFFFFVYIYTFDKILIINLHCNKSHKFLFLDELIIIFNYLTLLSFSINVIIKII